MLRVLLVEDDAVDREAARRAIGEGVELSEARSVAEAVGELLDDRPDCLLLDYNLPDGDSFRLLDICRKQAIAAVLLTGEARVDLAVEALQKGAQGYLVKGTYKAADLRRTLYEAVEKVALRRDLADRERQLERSKQSLDSRDAELRSLASELTLGEVRARRSAAERLHDELGFKLRKISKSLGELRVELKDTAQLSMLEAALSELGAAADLARDLSFLLSPPVVKNQGIADALAWLAGDLNRRYGLSTDVRIEGKLPVLDDARKLLVFQITGELLMNVIKHAGVGEAELVLSGSPGLFCAEVCDAGQGFDPEALPETWGLASARNRLSLFGARLVIAAAPDKGCQVRLEVPTDIS